MHGWCYNPAMRVHPCEVLHAQIEMRPCADAIRAPRPILAQQEKEGELGFAERYCQVV